MELLLIIGIILVGVVALLLISGSGEGDAGDAELKAAAGSRTGNSAARPTKAICCKRRGAAALECADQCF